MFTKLFSSITDSTIWREPDHVRLVWITMLAKCDKHGIVYASVPGLADAARVSLESCQDALLKLSSPDEWSRSKDDGGRRIHEVDGGWMLINHSKYKKIKDADERREYVRQKVQEHREKHKPVNNDVNNVNNVNTGKPGKHIRSDQIRSESDKEEESVHALNGKFVKPTADEVKARFRELEVADSESESFLAYYESNGWKVGRNPMKSWKAACVNWKKNMRSRPKSKESFI